MENQRMNGNTNTKKVVIIVGIVGVALAALLLPITLNNADDLDKKAKLAAAMEKLQAEQTAVAQKATQFAQIEAEYNQRIDDGVIACVDAHPSAGVGQDSCIVELKASVKAWLDSKSQP